jgi:hypothetical protein
MELARSTVLNADCRRSTWGFIQKSGRATGRSPCRGAQRAWTPADLPALPAAPTAPWPGPRFPSSPGAAPRWLPGRNDRASTALGHASDYPAAEFTAFNKAALASQLLPAVSGMIEMQPLQWGRAGQADRRRAAGQQRDLVAASTTFKEDLGTGKCVDFHKPNRTIETFESVFLTTEPAIRRLTRTDPPRVLSEFLWPSAPARHSF